MTTGSSKMPTFNLMPKEGLSLPRLSISVSMIIRLVLVCVDCVVIGIIGYYFAYYRGSYRQNLFHEELMVLVCATSAFINAAIFIVSSQYIRKSRFRQKQHEHDETVFRWPRLSRLHPTKQVLRLFQTL